MSNILESREAWGGDQTILQFITLVTMITPSGCRGQTYRSRETQKEAAQVKSVGAALIIKPCPSVNARSDYLYVKT